MDENLKLILDNFEKQGHVLVAGKRNLIKVFLIKVKKLQLNLLEFQF